MNSIEKSSRMERDKLSQKNYFESLIQEALYTGLLANEAIASLQTQIIGILTEQTKAFTCGESSSVRVETAQTILESIYYTIGLHLKSFSDPDKAVFELANKPLEGLFLEGQRELKEKIDEAKKLYAKVRASRIETLNYAYNATIDQGLKCFFTDYDWEFSAAETPGMIDYPISGNEIQTEGVEYILTYLERLLYENRYCKGFSKEEIHTVLLDFHSGYPDLLINIYETLSARVLADGSLPDIKLKEEVLPTIHFEDGQAMDDKAFRSLTEEIRDCRKTTDKLKLISDKIKSFTDLRDLLRSECLYGDEFSELFLLLGDMETALLYQETKDQNEDADVYLTENEKEWQSAYNVFLGELEPEYRQKIVTLSEKIISSRGEAKW